MNTAYLLLGSNIDKELNIPKAITLLKEKTNVVAVSRILETEPVGTINQANFHNCALEIETALNQNDLKRTIITPIENQLKRIRTTDPNSARTIDIDIIIYNGILLDEEIHIYDHIKIPIEELRSIKKHRSL